MTWPSCPRCAMWLDGAKLETLRPLSGLKVAKDPEPGRCRLRSVTDLVDLPALTSLDLSGNQDRGCIGARGLPALEQLTLSGNPIPAFAKARRPAGRSSRTRRTLQRHKNRSLLWKSPTTGSKRQKRQRPAAPPSRSVTGVVTNAEWSVKVTSACGKERSSSTGFLVTATSTATDAALEVEVESGQVRGYIERHYAFPGSTFKRRHGYAFCDASPGKPGRVSGSLTSGGPGNYGVSCRAITSSLRHRGEAKGSSSG